MNQLIFDNRAFEILKLLKDSCYESWFVGGCVRDALLAKPFDDYDLATTAEPQDIQALFYQTFELDLKAEKFGCIRLHNKGLWVEITTLREDISPDGRHTKVLFTNDIAKDATRRDFTINALYWDGEILDFAHGQADLKQGIVRFIGDPSDRVPQDYLRILRFFRFSALYSDTIDQPGLQVCCAYQEGLKYLSGTRVWGEWSKTLFGKNTANILQALSAYGVDITIFGGKIDLDIYKFYRGRDPLLLTNLLFPTVESAYLAHRLNLTVAQKDWLNAATSLKEDADFRLLYLEYGEMAKELLHYWGCKYAKEYDEILVDDFWNVKQPYLPIGGKDIIKLGCQPGPIVGNYLECAKVWWAQNNFKPSYQDCLDYAKSLFNK